MVSARSLRDRLLTLRHDRFVGREAEIGRFRAAVDAETLPHHVVHVHGPGGIGKTALLDEFRRACDEAGVAVTALDGRDVEASPSAVAEAVGPGAEGRRVLLVDTYEALAPLDGWFRRSFVPDLPETTLVVFAGRHAPAPEWRSDWGAAVRVEALGALAPAESEAYLAGSGVPAEAHAEALAFTRGHPLALALVADRYRQASEGAVPTPSAESPDIVRTLLDRFVATVPSPAHRRALEATSVVRSLTEPLLGQLLGGGDGAPEGPSAHDLFAWLRGLSFTEPDASGLRLHALVHALVEADLLWRDPAHHARVHGRARRFYTERLRHPAGEADRRETLGDYVHLYRDHPVVKPLLDQLHEAWAAADLEGSGPMRDGEAAAVRALVAQHEGEAAAAVVGRWIEASPASVEVFRQQGGAVAGFLLTLRLDAADEAARAADPVASAAWAATGPRLREGERVVLFRSWLDAEAHQWVSAVQSLVFARTVEVYLSTPDLAVSLLTCVGPDLWGDVFRFAGLRRWPEAEAAVGETDYAVFGKDWRAVPPSAWLDALADREPDADPSPADAEPVVLSEDAFTAAVRDALKGFATPHRLVESPLVQSRVVRARPEADVAAALQALLTEAADDLRLNPRDRPFARALDLTYFRPAPTQAIAAERLDLPFSTYRRHLRRGIDHVVRALWRREIGS